MSTAIVVDTTASPYALLNPVGIKGIRLSDAFYEPRRRINRTVTIPGQYRHLEDTARLDNFYIAAGKKEGKFEGIYFNDSDVYKWLEAATSALADPDLENRAELEAQIATAIQAVADAQQPDGYLNTYFMFEREKDRWTNLKDLHEMYCAGHLIQAAVAHFRATGTQTLLNVACRLADHIDSVFGDEPGKRPGACGHPEAETALVELYRATGEKRYLALAQHMVDVRGRKPSAVGSGSAYHQDHVPYRELHDVTGHAVRMLYLASGATDILHETGEDALNNAISAQWQNMTERRAYVTDGLGSRWEGEAFGKDYELPNARAYTETCAGIASVMWNHRLFLLTGDAKYADLVETTLINAVLPGLSLSGSEYYYQNPLENDGTHRRQAWFGCACCPPNVARLLAQLPGYVAATAKDSDSLFLTLYAAGTVNATLASGKEVTLTVRTGYPYDGEIEITFDGTEPAEFALNLRVPAWGEGASLTMGGKSEVVTLGTFATIQRTWKPGDTVRLSLPMDVRYVESHPYLHENAGRVAVLRGPIVYCAEGIDHQGIDLHDLYLPTTPGTFTLGEQADLPGVVILKGEGSVAPLAEAWQGKLYRKANGDSTTPATPAPVTLVPYYAWANRAPGQMTVWLPK